MGPYIKGVLLDNRQGVTEDSDHVLQVEQAGGLSLSVFCPPDLCDELVLNREYELIIRGTAFVSPDVSPDDCLRYYETPPDDNYTGWDGEVKTVGEVFQPGLLTKARPALYQGRWFVMATRLGHMILRSRILRPAGVDVAAGGILRFSGCRFDLYAVA